jgi:hypothetical protein
MRALGFRPPLAVAAPPRRAHSYAERSARELPLPVTVVVTKYAEKMIIRPLDTDSVSGPEYQ